MSYRAFLMRNFINTRYHVREGSRWGRIVLEGLSMDEAEELYAKYRVYLQRKGVNGGKPVPTKFRFFSILKRNYSFMPFMENGNWEKLCKQNWKKENPIYKNSEQVV